MTDIDQRRLRAEQLKGTREQRTLSADFEVRAAVDGLVTLSGYASVTEHDYQVGTYTERIARGAFRRTLGQSPDVVLLANHEGLPLGSTRSGSLDLEEDERGLRFTAQLDATDPDVDRVVRKVRRGDLRGASFAFRVTDQTWSQDHSRRLIKSLELAGGDISVVVHPANPAAGVGVRQAQRAVYIPDHTTRARERLAQLRRGSRPAVSIAPAAVSGPLDGYRDRLHRLRSR
jgi:uncharacterized protein